MFGAKAKFSATIEGKNITFNPAVSTYLIYYHDFGFEDPTEGIQNWDGFCRKLPWLENILFIEMKEWGRNKNG